MEGSSDNNDNSGSVSCCSAGLETIPVFSQNSQLNPQTLPSFVSRSLKLFTSAHHRCVFVDESLTRA